MNRHDLSNKELYPRSHVWVTQKKVNIISNKEIKQFDRLLVDSEEHIIGSICKKDKVANYIIETVANTSEKSKFYEVKIL